MLWIDINSCQVTSLKRAAANTVATFLGQQFDGLCAWWIFYAVCYCGTVCYCLPFGDRWWGVPQITGNSNCFNPTENLKYLQIKNVAEIFLCACVFGKTVGFVFQGLILQNGAVPFVLLRIPTEHGIKKILSNILARNIWRNHEPFFNGPPYPVSVLLRKFFLFMTHFTLWLTSREME